MYKIQKLKNELNLITIPVRGTQATTVLALIPIGSRYEHRDISGASHFVEHLMFKGTAKRPTAMDISRELDAVGAEYNAFTAKDYTGYYIKINSAKKELAFDMISDMLFESTFPKEEIDRERGVIVEELRMYEDNPTMGIGMLFDHLIFGDCPLGWDEGGDVETVKKISHDDLWNYYKTAYQPKNLVLVVSGNITSQQATKFAEKYFVRAVSKRPGKTMSKNSFQKFVWTKKNIPLKDRVEVKEKKVDQAHVILGFPGLKADDPKRYVANVLLNILGGGMSSRLFVEVREKRGLAYMVRTGGNGYKDVGVTYVQAGLDPKRLPEALKVIKSELKKISTELVSERELKDAKENIAGRITLAMEESSAQAEWFAKQFWFSNKMEKPADTIANIRKVKAEEVRRLAKSIFDFDKMYLAVIGAVKKQEVLEMLQG